MRYNELRAVGYTSKEANKIKDRGNASYVEAVKVKGRGKLKEVQEIIKRVSIESGFTVKEANQIKKMSKENVKSSIQSGIVFDPLAGEISYKDWKGANKRYLSNFTVVVRYTAKNQLHKEVLEKFVTVTGMDRIDRREAITKAKKWVKEGVEAGAANYPGKGDYKVNFNSFEVVEAWEQR